MKITKTKLEGCVIIEPIVFEDSRGYFFESFHQEKFEKELGRKVSFVQDNRSHSKKGTLRGLHYQQGESAQAKLVSVLSGKILDVAVDMRSQSRTYGHYFSIELSSKNKKQLFVPRGFAHGFVVLSDSAEFFYKCDNYYNREAEAGIIFNDPSLNIDWGLPLENLIISEKDKNLPTFQEALK